MIFIHYWIFKFINYRKALKYYGGYYTERISFDIFKSTFDIVKKQVYIKEYRNWGLKTYLVYYKIPGYFHDECYIDFSFIDYIKFIYFINQRKRKKQYNSNQSNTRILTFLHEECEKEIQKYQETVEQASKDIIKIMERMK